MKIIINSKHLAVNVKLMLERDCISLEEKDGGIIEFSNETRSFELYCHVTEHMDGRINVDRIAWYRVMKLCKSIPEQPITVIIQDDHIDVYCEHRFKTYNELP